MQETLHRQHEEREQQKCCRVFMAGSRCAGAQGPDSVSFPINQHSQCDREQTGQGVGRMSISAQSLH